MKSFDKLLISGCSFSAGSSDIKTGTVSPSTWSHFLLPKINPKIFVNLAIPGGGNIAAGYNLVYLLETKKFFSPSDTLVLFNITGLDRHDIMCYNDNSYANPSFSWSKDFGFGWITDGGYAYQFPPLKGVLQKNMGLEQVIATNSLSIINTITYLEANNFQYAFMLMDQYVQESAPFFLKRFLEQRHKNLITFDKDSNMFEYCKSNQWLDTDMFHPSLTGYESISNFVYRHIEEIHTPSTKHQ